MLSKGFLCHEQSLTPSAPNSRMYGSILAMIQQPVEVLELTVPTSKAREIATILIDHNLNPRHVDCRNIRLPPPMSLQNSTPEETSIHHRRENKTKDVNALLRGYMPHCGLTNDIACLTMSFEVRDRVLATATTNQSCLLVEAAIVAFLRISTAV